MNSACSSIQAQDVAPVPGQAFVKIEAKFRANEGGIIIPAKYRQRASCIARVLKASPKPDTARMWNDWGIIGKRCVVANHALSPLPAPLDGLHRVPLSTDTILAILPDDLDVEVSTDAPGRCTHCGAAQSGTTNTVLLDPLGYCVRCGRNADGDLRDMTPKVTDEEVEHFRKIGRRQARR